MGFFEKSSPPCHGKKHCSQWVRKYMKYCLCNAKDGASLTLGLISVLSWGVAEIPQIITNYKEKSADGLSLAFLLTWIVGDLFNLFGCMLEPATLPTQYYMAMLYAITTAILTSQAIYYGHIYHRLKSSKLHSKGPNSKQIDAAEKNRQSSDVGVKQINANRWRNGSSLSESINVLSSPIPLPSPSQISSPGRELYYTSARSLSKSHTPTAGSFLAQRMTSSIHDLSSIEEPLLDELLPTQSTPPSNTKTMLCLVSTLTFLGTLNVYRSDNIRLNMESQKTDQGVVIQVGRKLLQVSGMLLHANVVEESSGIGTYLGWGMAAIYMGGRLPQIYLNIKRGHLEGLNPLMFIFALFGNTTYVASILVSSLEWWKIKPNLPWLVDAAGCVLLDTFILLQFIYFRYRDKENKLGSSNMD